MKDIYCFNPTGEMAIANGNASYMPPRALRKFENDLAFMPSFFAQNNDIVISPQIPDSLFIKRWQDVGLPKLNYIDIKEALCVEDINYLRPWSWSPASHHYFKALKEQCNNDFKTSPNYQWKDNYKQFFSRDSCNKVQDYIANNSNQCPVKIRQAAINLFTIEEVKDWIKLNPKAVIKMPWSSSGRGIHTVDFGENKPLNIEWVKGAIKQQGFVTAEPLLNKVKDFSYQLKLHKNGDIDFLGISHFSNDAKGHFTGGIINWPHNKDEITDFFTSELIEESAQLLIEGIKSIEPQLNYEGYIGVDGIVYLDENTDLKIHPCLDINWRYNMGNVNIQLPNFLHPKSKGTWNVSSVKEGNWNEFTNALSKKKPLITSGSKIISGFIPLTPPSANAQFAAWMEVRT